MIVILIWLILYIQCINSLVIPTKIHVHISCKNVHRNSYNSFQSALTSLSKPDIDSGTKIEIKPRASYSIPALVMMFIISAPLGMVLDNYHGLFGVLHYNANSLPITISIANNVILKTAAWVPLLFGCAGVAMSVIGQYLDDILSTPTSIRQPSWPKTFYSISLFSFQYYLSGLFDQIGMENIDIHIILAIFAMVGFFIFDSSLAGFGLALATAVSGTLAELILINKFDLYFYTHSDWLGICTWIPWVYFLGAPAVLNVYRSMTSTTGK
jgi:hypothetical protein